MIKPEFPPLLPQGFHALTTDELRALIVDKFPLSQSRPELWESLLWLVDQLKSLRIKCKLWLDGSLLTEKVEPDDVDVVVDVAFDALNAATPLQRAFLGELSAHAFRDAPKKLHTFLIFSAPFGHVAAPRAAVLRDQWIKDFGFSFRKRTPKGIALLDVVP